MSDCDTYCFMSYPYGETISWIIGLVSIVEGIFDILIITSNETMNKIRSNTVKVMLVECYIFLVLHTLNVFACVLVLIGVSKSKSSFVLPSLIINAVLVAIYIIAFTIGNLYRFVAVALYVWAWIGLLITYIRIDESTEQREEQPL